MRTRAAIFEVRSDMGHRFQEFGQNIVVAVQTGGSGAVGTAHVFAPQDRGPDDGYAFGLQESADFIGKTGA